MARQLRVRPAAADRVPAGGRDHEQLPLRQPLLDAFEVLYEAEGLPSYLLPFDLERIYGGIGFPDPVVYSNFVTSIDGVATLGDTPSAGSVLSAKNPGDRFLMALLRACADAVLVGAGTLRATPGHLWTAGHVYPALAASFAGLRRSLGRSAEPRLVVLTSSGDLDVSHTALKQGATILTTAAGAQALHDRVPAACEVRSLTEGDRVDVARAVDELRNDGRRVVLTEGGPHVMGELIKARLLDEAFVTVSPVLAGRDQKTRFGMVEGVELLPAAGVWTRLLSARRHGDLLFLRYGLPGKR
ncbi:MAG TPA: dihydrofolate reductase family protein [Candidatus Dormibacteraeota bacterium]|nr:dihydrofolate reductase family protein [Candidatus Dormibacteraeota bacterium]